jgi:hypothetical protein
MTSFINAIKKIVIRVFAYPRFYFNVVGSVDVLLEVTWEAVTHAQ